LPGGFQRQCGNRLKFILWKAFEFLSVLLAACFFFFYLKNSVQNYEKYSDFKDIRPAETKLALNLSCKQAPEFVYLYPVTIY